MPRRLKNIRKWKGGWQAYTEIHGKTHSKSFPLTTSVDDMRKWLKDERDKYATVKETAGSFGADIAAYLPRVRSIATYAQRVIHLEQWAQLLGRDRPRRTITTADIDRILQQWLVDGLSASTVKRRRGVLLSMWNTLDGKQATNPVRASLCPREPKPEARGMSYDVIERILATMTYPSTGRLRIAVLAWTGLPPGMLAKVQAADVNLDAKTVRVRPRRKGAGVEARTIPLLPQGVKAFRALVEADGLGGFNVPALNQTFVRACRRADPSVEGMSLYDLRHSFLTMLYRVTKDLATVARFAMHANVAMSQRYAQGAMQDVDRAAAESLGKTLSPTPVQPNKSRKKKHLHK